MKRLLITLALAAVIVGGILWLTRDQAAAPNLSQTGAAFVPPALPASTAAWPVYTNAQFGFSLHYPAGWHDLGALTAGQALPKVYSNQTSLNSTDPSTAALIVDSAPGTSPTQCYPKLSDQRYRYTQSGIMLGGLSGTKYLLNPSAAGQSQPQFGVGYVLVHQNRCYDVSLIAGSAGVRDNLEPTAELTAQTLRFH